jgi:hypothetical protein
VQPGAADLRGRAVPGAFGSADASITVEYWIGFAALADERFFVSSLGNA